MGNTIQSLVTAFVSPARSEGLVLASIDQLNEEGTPGVVFAANPKISKNTKAIFVNNVEERRNLFSSGKLDASKVNKDELANLLTREGTRKPLFVIHGFKARPDVWIQLCKDAQKTFDVQEGTKYNLIPVCWPGNDPFAPLNPFDLLGYSKGREDATNGAKAMKHAFSDAAQALAQAGMGGMDILGVSMGNWVLKEIGSKNEDGTPLGFSFDNIYMSAADVDETIFEAGQQDGIDIVDMLSKDGGNGKVYVFHNREDAALNGSSLDGQRRLGLDGATKKGVEEAKGKVKNVNVNDDLSDKGDHNYVFYPWVAKFYAAEPKPDELGV